MLPTSRTKALTQALDQLSTRSEASEQSIRVRVRLADGSSIQGELDGISQSHLALTASDDQRRHELAPADILEIRVAAPNRKREWLLALGGILVSVPALMGVAALLGYSLQHEAQRAFVVVYVAGAGAMHLLLRTRFREWLTSWDLWFRAGDA